MSVKANKANDEPAASPAVTNERQALGNAFSVVRGAPGFQRTIQRTIQRIMQRLLESRPDACGMHRCKIVPRGASETERSQEDEWNHGGEQSESPVAQARRIDPT